MPAGIQVLNTVGSVSIDQDYSNFGLRSKGTANVEQPTDLGSEHPYGSSGGWIGGVVRLTVTATYPLIALKADFYTSVIILKDLGGGSWSVWIECGATSGTLSWWCFDIMQNLPGAGYGLQVFDAYSNKVFDSNAKYMRIADVVEHANCNSGYGESHDYFTNTYTSGRQYAVITAKPSVAWWVDFFFSPDEGWFFQHGGTKGGDSSVQFGDFCAWHRTSFIPGEGFSEVKYANWKGLVVDVTNL